MLEYPFNYPSIWRMPYTVVLFSTKSCILSKFLYKLQKFVTLIPFETQRSSAGPEPADVKLHLSNFGLSARPNDDLILTSVPLKNRKRSHIGIRIFIRIIYYPVNGYPDSKLSVLSIPSCEDQRSRDRH